MALVRLLSSVIVLTGFLQPSWAHGPLSKQIAQLTREIEKDPVNPSLYLRRGELHYLHDDWKASLQDYDRAAILDPSLEVISLYRGKTMFAAGRFDEANDHLTDFLSSQPNHSLALLTRARVLTKLRRYSMAASAYDRFIELTSEPRPEHYLERAQLLSETGAEHLRAALAGLDEGMERLGQIVTLQLCAIDLELRLERYRQALGRLQQVSIQSARKEKWLMRKGEILHQAGRPDEAVLAFEAALKTIQSLPTRRRRAKATVDLENRIREALEK